MVYKLVYGCRQFSVKEITTSLSIWTNSWIAPYLINPVSLLICRIPNEVLNVI